MKYICISFLILLSINGCILLPPKLITAEEKKNLPHLKNILNTYIAQKHSKLAFQILKPKIRGGSRFYQSVIAYNIYDKKEIEKIFCLLQSNVNKAPSWYYVKVQFYETKNIVPFGSPIIRRNGRIIAEKTIKPIKKKKSNL
jgi:hypothetical protein